MRPPLSSAAEDYLKALLHLEWEGGWSRGDGVRVSTNAVARHLGVSAASATAMLKKLDAAGLVTHVPYRGAGLAAEGRRSALAIVRRHRLLETYLAVALGVPWDRLHAEAEVLEHVLSEDLEARIAAALGHPSTDPHGHPIPGADGSLPPPSGRRLWEVPVGERTTVAWVPDHDPAALRYLGEVGLRPGAEVEVSGRGPASGPLFVRVAAAPEVRAISQELAEAVWAA